MAKKSNNLQRSNSNSTNSSNSNSSKSRNGEQVKEIQQKQQQEQMKPDLTATATAGTTYSSDIIHSSNLINSTTSSSSTNSPIQLNKSSSTSSTQMSVHKDEVNTSEHQHQLQGGLATEHLNINNHYINHVNHETIVIPSPNVTNTFIPIEIKSVNTDNAVVEDDMIDIPLTPLPITPQESNTTPTSSISKSSSPINNNNNKRQENGRDELSEESTSTASTSTTNQQAVPTCTNTTIASMSSELRKRIGLEPSNDTIEIVNTSDHPKLHNSVASTTTRTTSNISTTNTHYIQTINYIPPEEQSILYTNDPRYYRHMSSSWSGILAGSGGIHDHQYIRRSQDSQQSVPYIPPGDLKLNGTPIGMMSSNRKDKKKEKKIEKEIKDAMHDLDEKHADVEKQLIKMSQKNRKKKKKRARKLHLEHKKNSLGETIFKGHPSWFLMRTIQTGILNCISKTSYLSIPEDSDQFFSSLHHELPVIEGQPGTFLFKDYCPHAFSRLRSLFNIDAQSYVHSLCKAWNEQSTPGKSGSIFFFSHDNQYVLKTIPKREAKLLRSLLPEYFEHMKRNPNSLLTKFFGLHRVKPRQGRQVRFVVMKNLFNTPKIITSRFDIKGSTVGRELTTEELKKKHPTFKDLDFRRMGTKINLGPDRKKLFLHQIGEDCKFLVKLNIMDYSLLIGVHRKEDAMRMVEQEEILRESQGGGGGGETATADTTGNTTLPCDDYYSSSEDEDYSDEDDDLTDEDDGDDLRASSKIGSIAQTKQYFKQIEQQKQQQLDELQRTQHSSSASNQHYSHPLIPVHLNDPGHPNNLNEQPSQQQQQPRGSSSSSSNQPHPHPHPPHPHLHHHHIVHKDSCLVELDGPFPPLVPKEEKSPIQSVPPKISIFEHDKGGMQGIDETGKPMPEYYFMGIIDILMLFSFRKQFEHTYKSIFHKGEISAVEPVEYAARFINSIRDHVIK
ncbi:putative phosphatidylinositol phosphate kinase [Cavenderia fasciculata]|uniref:Phosphatidylinositol phosphate kinase n=1 Tax=Cavenderia fasciculata TaxID=261658 RepID=F4PUM1_CACFS|nr:putative phosphatidylinositol phosphate kinase [Cavenderia fasciculata]EGG21885.1 putative phosphatidylinositol phosphate kinase [Cavenderia fasciculata]|eukprot:XP_004359736.1 putative phosphatidylinositol phosphate kinase [Cavenderia fasciculata]